MIKELNLRIRDLRKKVKKLSAELEYATFNDDVEYRDYLQEKVDRLGTKIYFYLYIRDNYKRIFG